MNNTPLKSNYGKLLSVETRCWGILVQRLLYSMSCSVYHNNNIPNVEGAMHACTCSTRWGCDLATRMSKQFAV